jgi:molybdopterin-guanine dinucleotide biosynthesis protein A
MERDCKNFDAIGYYSDLTVPETVSGAYNLPMCNTEIDLSNVTLAILAGGAGSRMGLPKSWMSISGRPILAWLLDRMEWPGPKLLVSAPGLSNPPGVELFGRTVVDSVIGQGPLRGILTALENISTPMAAIMTVDMPMVTQEMLAWLLEKLIQEPQRKGIICRAPAQKGTKIEPFPSVFRKEAAAIINTRMNSGRLSVQGLCNEAGFQAEDVPADWPDDAWVNLNSPADLAAFEARWNSGKVLSK